MNAADEKQATKKLRLDLKSRGMQLDNIQWCVNHNPRELERADPKYEDASLGEARRHGIVYDRIYPIFK